MSSKATRHFLTTLPTRLWAGPDPLWDEAGPSLKCRPAREPSLSLLSSSSSVEGRIMEGSRQRLKLLSSMESGSTSNMGSGRKTDV